MSVYYFFKEFVETQKIYSFIINLLYDKKVSIFSYAE